MTETFSFNPKAHGYPFDPTYGYTLDALKQVRVGEAPADFEMFWRSRYEMARNIRTEPELVRNRRNFDEHWSYDFDFSSTAGAKVGGWLLLPKTGIARRALVVTHGYGGCESPRISPGWGDFVVFQLCLRGFNRSAQKDVPAHSNGHVVHGILDRNEYILGRCVEDIWCAISALEESLPDLAGHVGYSGVSFGGGIGALAVPWDPRIRRIHLEVPTFGHQRLRLTLPTVGSGHAVSMAHLSCPDEVSRTLSYYDAAFAARYLQQPGLFACARFDPAVAPPGQWAIYNEGTGPKELYVLEAGHFAYPRQAIQAAEHESILRGFFEPL